MKLQDLEKYSITLFDVKDQLRDHVYRRSQEAFAAGERARDEITEPGQLKERQAYMRAKLIESFGGLPSGETPLKAIVTGSNACDGFTIENIIFESRPQNYVTANMYIPAHIQAPSAAVLFVCGHHDEAKHHPEYQKVCQYLVHAGLIVLAVDPVGQGERLGYYDPQSAANLIGPGTDEHDYIGNQCWPLGDGLAKYFLHDIIRSVDYLCTRPEVDPARIGITGNSGGGMQTAMAMVCEERLAAAAPATFIMNRESYMYSGQAQDAEQIWPGMSAIGFDHEDIVLAMAPRPVMVLAVTEDFFPIEGTRRTVERAKRFWEMFGNEDDLSLVEDESTHKYTESLASAAATFFAKNLLGADVIVNPQLISPLKPSLLWCTKIGQVRGDFADARTVFDENQMRLAELGQERGELPEPLRKQRAVMWLRDKVYADRRFGSLNPRYSLNTSIDGEQLQVRTLLWRSQDMIFNHAAVIRDVRFVGEKLPVTIALWEGGTQRLQSHIDWIRRKCQEGNEVMVLDVTGTGALEPKAINDQRMNGKFGTIYKLTTDLIWLGDSLAAIRTFDVIRSIDMALLLRGNESQPIQIYANGNYSIYAELAAALDERICNLEVEEGFRSAVDWVSTRLYHTESLTPSFSPTQLIIPGMLAYFDLPDLQV